MTKRKEPSAVLAATLAALVGLGGLQTGCDCSDSRSSPLAPGGGPPAVVAFAGHGYGPDVDVIDVDTMTLITTIQGAGGYRMVLTPDGKKLYSTGGDSFVYVSDAENYVLLTSMDPSLSVPDTQTSELEGIAISPDGTRVYVADESTDYVFAIDTATDTVVQGAWVDLDEAENLAMSPDGTYLYIVDNSYVLRLDAASLSNPLWGDEDPESDVHGLAVDADGWVYVQSSEQSNAVAIYTPSDMIVHGNRINNAWMWYYAELGKEGRYIYGVSEDSDLYVIDTFSWTVAGQVTLSTTRATGVTTTPDGATVLVAGRSVTDGGLIRLDAATLAETGKLGGVSYQSVAVK